MELQIADYVLVGLASAMVVLGVFRGFSGTLAFFLSVAAASAAATFGWTLSAEYMALAWVRVAAVSAASLAVFGLVRILVAKTVHLLLAQPTDAILGAFAGAACFLVLVYAWTYVGTRVHDDYPAVRDCSSLITLCAHYVG